MNKYSAEIFDKSSDKVYSLQDPIKGCVEIDDHNVYFTAEGYGPQSVVMIERWEGELRVVIYADANSDEPTNIISLENAKV